LGVLFGFVKTQVLASFDPSFLHAMHQIIISSVYDLDSPGHRELCIVPGFVGPRHIYFHGNCLFLATIENIKM
jgi:hypothetical protein